MHTGDSENGFTEIIDEANLVGKNIVVKGAYNLLMTMKNKVEEWGEVEKIKSLISEKRLN